MRLQDLTERDVVWCPTEEEATKFIKMATDAGYMKGGNPPFTENSRWYVYKHKTCYYMLSGSYGSIDGNAKQKDLNIYSVSAFLEQTIPSLLIF